MAFMDEYLAGQSGKREARHKERECKQTLGEHGKRDKEDAFHMIIFFRKSPF